VVFADFEGKIGLRYITECHYDNRCTDFSDGGIKMELLHEYFQEYVVEQYRPQDRQEITEELGTARHGGTLEDHVSRQGKSDGESEKKRKHESGDVRADGDKWQDEVLLPENKVVADKKQENIQHGVGTATGCITKRKLVHQLAEGRIEKIYDAFNGLFHTRGNVYR
jgi:hypothetical protein